MTGDQALGRGEIRSALAELDAIARDEYGPDSGGLGGLLADRSPLGALRVQRVIGISLKKPFAEQQEAAHDSETSARHSWPWKPASPEDAALTAPREFAVLEALRKPGPWNEFSTDWTTGDAASQMTWEQFKDDVEHERGLFKVAILYVEDRINRRHTRSFSEYFDADESPEFEAGLDLADKLFDAAVLTPLYAVLGVPGLAVGIALVGLRYGYRRATDPESERVGDAFA